MVYEKSVVFKGVFVIIVIELFTDKMMWCLGFALKLFWMEVGIHIICLGMFEIFLNKSAWINITCSCSYAESST
jgi:hypothetical protein